jgi:transposase
VSYVQASQDLGVHPSQLRDWVKKFADDPQHAFPGHGLERASSVAGYPPAIWKDW